MSHDPLAEVGAAGAEGGASQSTASPDGTESGQPGAESETPLAAVQEPGHAEAEKAAGSAGGESAPDADDAMLCLDSTLTIAEVADVYQQMAVRLDTGAPVSIDGSTVEIIDGAGLQLVAAFVKDAERREQPIAWQGMSDTLAAAIATLGLSASLGVDRAVS